MEAPGGSDEPLACQAAELAANDGTTQGEVDAEIISGSGSGSGSGEGDRGDYIEGETGEGNDPGISAFLENPGESLMQKFA